MKTRLLLFLIVSITFEVSAFGRKHIKLEQEKQLERSIGYRLCAYLDDSSLLIDSFDLISELDVTIVDVTTDEVIYKETYIDFDITSIDVTTLDAGEYRLQLTLDNTTYLGNFSINN